MLDILKKYIIRLNIKMLPMMVLLMGSSVLAFFIIYNPYFLLGDNSQFFNTSAIGKYFPASTYINWMGRFCPLQVWDFNILLLFKGGESALAHYILIAVYFLLLSFFSFVFYTKLINSINTVSRYKYWLIVSVVIFILTRFYSVFLDLFFGERFAIVLLSIFLYFYYKLTESDNWIYALIAFLSVLYVTYSKEPTFLAILILSLTNLLFNYKGISIKKKFFYFALIVNSVIYISLYYFIVYKGTPFFYNQINPEIETKQLLLKVFRMHKILIIAFLLAFVRLYFVVLKSDKSHLFHDSTLFAGISYATVILALKLSYVQYFFPAVILSLPSIIYWSTKIFNIKIMSLIMLMGAVYCSFSAANHIRANQTARINTHSNINLISESMSDGYSVSSYSPSLKQFSNGEYKETSRNFRIGSVEAYLQYFNKFPDFKIINIDSSTSKEYLQKTILLYPPENDVSNDMKKIFDEFTKAFGYKYVGDFGGIRVYKN